MSFVEEHEEKRGQRAIGLVVAALAYGIGFALGVNLLLPAGISVLLYFGIDKLFGRPALAQWAIAISLMQSALGLFGALAEPQTDPLAFVDTALLIALVAWFLWQTRLPAAIGLIVLHVLSTLLLAGWMVSGTMPQEMIPGTIFSCAIRIGVIGLLVVFIVQRRRRADDTTPEAVSDIFA